MKEIRLDRYMPELSALYAFYRYSELAFDNPETRLELEKAEFQSMHTTALHFLKDSPVPPGDLPGRLETMVRERVADEIRNGLAALRRQILETAHSIFEKFLCHVVRVYFHVFPEILKNIDKTVMFREVVDLKEKDAVFDHIVEKEISDFSRRSLQEKKDYLVKHLKLTNQDDLYLKKGSGLFY